ncbi:hypothetical protein HYC85_023867 [Camellia sinensis]|uniref:Uncharacterized protein n=1 Tax=Camellia sinensis TaxID=4442 RepID=A0A7J7GJP5_CAMSI|nr:hypothetical protein HYC85_023867 [Camellia sinensis]
MHSSTPRDFFSSQFLLMIDAFNFIWNSVLRDFFKGTRFEIALLSQFEHENIVQYCGTDTRKTGSGAGKDNISDAPNGSTHHKKSVVEKELSHSPSNLVFGYLNLFSDGVHNFTGGMALGSAFLLYGSVGGSNFSVSKALFFNLLSALVALARATLVSTVLVWQVESLTTSRFMYIAVAKVLTEMNNGSSSTIKSTVLQLTSLISGMAITLCLAPAYNYTLHSLSSLLSTQTQSAPQATTASSSSRPLPPPPPSPLAASSSVDSSSARPRPPSAPPPSLPFASSSSSLRRRLLLLLPLPRQI